MLRFESVVGARLHRLRGIIFTRTKMGFWREVITATTTPTQPPADEFDHPDTISELRINRVR
jgi:hypothetical protein